jgi:FkbM family methyltransferase
MYRAYLKARYHDGKVVTIQAGPLKGMRLHKFVRTIGEWHVRGDLEPDVVDAILRHAAPGSTFFDVGANAGYMTLVGAKAVGPTGKVVAFEPMPNTARELAAQARLNGLANVTVVRAAVCDREGDLTFVSGPSSDMAGMAEVGNTGGESVTVPGTTIDAAAERYGPPAMIKIDIEGAELLALRGARKTLERHRPILLTELHTAELAIQCLALLDELKYRHHDTAGTPIDRTVWTRFVVSTPG